MDRVPTEARMITTLRFCHCCLVVCPWMTRQKSTSIQATFHPGHQEVECHERDFPKCEEMTEASTDKNSEKRFVEGEYLSSPGVIAASLHSILSEKNGVRENWQKKARVDVCSHSTPPEKRQRGQWTWNKMRWDDEERMDYKKMCYAALFEPEEFYHRLQMWCVDRPGTRNWLNKSRWH